MTGVLHDDRSLECKLLWRLARLHTWGSSVEIHELVRQANVQNERGAREMARSQLASRHYVDYHRGRDEIRIQGPPTADLFYHLRDQCGYGKLQIEATFSSYFDGF